MTRREREKKCSPCIQDRQENRRRASEKRRKMREKGPRVSQLDEKCREGTPEGLTITPVPLCGASGTRNERISSKIRGGKKKAELFFRPKKNTKKGKTGDVYEYTDVSIDVISLGRWMEGLRSKDDRNLDRIHTHTHQEADGV